MFCLTEDVCAVCSLVLVFYCLVHFFCHVNLYFWSYWCCQCVCGVILIDRLVVLVSIYVHGRYTPPSKPLCSSVVSSVYCVILVSGRRVLFMCVMSLYSVFLLFVFFSVYCVVYLSVRAGCIHLLLRVSI